MEAMRIFTTTANYFLFIFIIFLHPQKKYPPLSDSDSTRMSFGTAENLFKNNLSLSVCFACLSVCDFYEHIILIRSSPYSIRGDQEPRSFLYYQPIL